MSYIIYAELYLDTEMNMHGDLAKFAARPLSRNGKQITLDVAGKFGEEKERTLALCKTLIDAGFVEFYIGHSF